MIAAALILVVLALLLRQHGADALQAHHDMCQHQAAELGAVDQLASMEEVQP